MKFYVVTRKDLNEAQQAVQCTHAAIDYCLAHPEHSGPWHSQSNFLVLLEADSEKHLMQLHKTCKTRGLSTILFREPDLANQVTALAIQPGKLARRICKHLPLLLNQKENA
jgi:peptidyl-tRNA hydrolase